MVGDLDRLGRWRGLTVLVQRRDPVLLGVLEDRSADCLGQLIADGELDLAIAAPVGQLMASAGAVDPHQDLDALDVLGGDLRECLVDHRDLIGGGVRAGVPGTQPPGDASPVSSRVSNQRVEPVAALVVPAALLLLGMRGDQRGVHVDRQPLRRADQFPQPGSRSGVRRAQRLEQPGRRRDPLDHPERGRGRRHRPEQNGLITGRSRSARHSPPSASITARSRITRPRSWLPARNPGSPTATDSARVSPACPRPGRTARCPRATPIPSVRRDLTVIRRPACITCSEIPSGGNLSGLERDAVTERFELSDEAFGDAVGVLADEVVTAKVVVQLAVLQHVPGRGQNRVSDGGYGL